MGLVAMEYHSFRGKLELMDDNSVCALPEIIRSLSYLKNEHRTRLPACTVCTRDSCTTEWRSGEGHVVPPSSFRLLVLLVPLAPLLT